MNYFKGKNKISKKAKLVAFNFVENSQIGECEIYGSKIVNSIVEDGSIITNSVIENSVVKKGCVVGPFFISTKSPILQFCDTKAFCLR